MTNLRGEQGYYLIGAHRLRELLGMSLEEEMAVNFFESKRSVLRKEAKRITKEKREKRNARIVALFRQGSYTYASIAKQVMCSVRTVAAVISTYKQNQRHPVLVNITRYNKKVLDACNFLSYEFRQCLLDSYLSILVTSLGVLVTCMTETLPTSVFVTRIREGFFIAVRKYLYTKRLVQ